MIMLVALVVALSSICEDARVDVTAGPNPQDAPILDAGTTYAVAGFAANKRSFLVFEAQVSGTHELSFGGPPIPAAVREVPPTATKKPVSCMRSTATYEFVAGERYEIELGAIPPGLRVLFHVKAPVEGDRIALTLDRGGLGLRRGLGGRALLRTVDVFDGVVAGQALVRHQRVAIAEHLGALGVAAPLLFGTRA
jgi:hypothetical protein